MTAAPDPVRVTPQQGRLDTVQFLRFAAASAVVGVHLPRIGFGHWGVDLFFVISGFIMMYATEQSAENFLLKRLIRVAPSYWLLTFSVFAIALVVPGLLNNTTANPLHLINSLFFIPFDKNGGGHLPILFVGWTLNFEMYFYLLFTIALKLSHKHRGLISGALIVVVLLTVHQLQPGYPLHVYQSSITIEFLFGMAAFQILCRPIQWKMHTTMLMLLALLPFIMGAASLEDRGYAFGLPAFLVFLVALRFLRNVRYPQIILLQGEASYALYLTHAYVVLALSKTGIFWSGTVTGWLATLAAYLICLLLAAVYLKYVEAPMGRYLRKRFL